MAQKPPSKFTPYDPDAESWAQPLEPNLIPGDPARPKRRQKPYFSRHRSVRVWLSHGEYARLAKILKRSGRTQAEWMRDAIARDEAQRPSEAGQYVRKIVPEYEAQAAAFSLQLLGEVFLGVANAQAPTDWDYRRRLRETGGHFLDAAAWFQQVIADYARIHRAQETAPHDPSTTAETAGRTVAPSATGPRPARPPGVSAPTSPPTPHSDPPPGPR